MSLAFTPPRDHAECLEVLDLRVYHMQCENELHGCVQTVQDDLLS